MKIYLVMPARNEEKRIGAVLKKIKDLYGKNINVVVVNDFSTDNTGKIAKKYGARVIMPPTHEGVGLSTITGLNYVLKNGADIIILMDSDGQHRPEDIKKFIESIKEGYDHAIGQRDLSKYPFIKKFGNYGMSILSRIITPTGIKDPECGFRSISAKAARKIKLRGGKYNICMDFVYNSWKYKLKTKQVKIHVPMYYSKKGTKISTGINNILFLIRRRLTD
jgi:glycosyltransferase involved in cell wall biosynthesis